MPDHQEVIEGLIRERDAARELALRILTDPYGDTLEERIAYYREQYEWVEDHFNADQR